MKFKWTIEELELVSDEELIETLITERRSTLNAGRPLDNRLGSLASHREAQQWTPNLLGICKEIIFLEKTAMTKRQVKLVIARAKDALTRYTA